MDIVTLAAARKGSGSGGDVTKQYVDEHLALKADKTETAEYPIADSTTGINPSITDSADGLIQDVKVYGRTDTVEGELRGIGEDGEVDVVTCGKNLVNVPDKTITDVGFIFYYDPFIKNYIKDSGNLTFSFDFSGGEGLAQILLYNDNSSVVWDSGAFNIINGRNTVVINNPGNATYVNFFSNAIGTYSNFQLELGSTATAYEPYVSTTATLTTGLPYCGIPVTTGETYTDEQGQKWLADMVDIEGVTKRVYKVTFDGSEDENWTMSGTLAQGSYRALVSIPATGKNHTNSEVPKLFTDFTQTIVTPDVMYSGTGALPCATTTGDGLEFAIRISNISTIEDLKTYLASNPITVVYELATPTTQELTDTEKSALLNLKTFDSTTNVTITDNPTVDVGYLLDTDNGQAVADVQTDLQEQISNIPAWITDIPENHKNIYRGKYLGTSVSAAQLAAIADGSFDDLYVGDYWEIPVTIDGTTVSNKWRIADFDYFFHNGTDKHHAVIVPDNTLYTAQMGGTVSNGYYQSAMFTTNLNKGRTAIANAFPDMVISYEYYDVIGQTSTKYDCTVELMTLSSLTGVYSDYIHTNYLPVLSQMSLFRIMPDFIGANPNGSGHDAGFLTQTVQSSSFYWAISTTVTMMRMSTSDSYGVRPFFLLGDTGT